MNAFAVLSRLGVTEHHERATVRCRQQGSPVQPDERIDERKSPSHLTGTFRDDRLVANAESKRDVMRRGMLRQEQKIRLLLGRLSGRVSHGARADDDDSEESVYSI